MFEGEIDSQGYPGAIIHEAEELSQEPVQEAVENQEYEKSQDVVEQSGDPDASKTGKLLRDMDIKWQWNRLQRCTS